MMVHVGKEVTWVIVPDANQWEVRKSWRYQKRYDASDKDWVRDSIHRYDTLDEAMLAIASDYRDNSSVPRGMRMSLGPMVCDGDEALYNEKLRGVRDSG